MQLRIISTSLLAALAALTASQVSRADSVNIASQTGEMMMNVQFQDELLLQSAVPWNVGDALNYIDTYNTSSGSFTFATLPGQTLAGLAFSFTTVGTLDSSTGIWTWSGTGFDGSTGFDLTGSGTVTLDPDPVDIKGKYHDDNGNEYDATGTVTVEQTETGEKSSGTGTAKDANGKVVKSGNITDFRSLQNPKDMPWEINFAANQAPFGPPAFAGGVDVFVGGNQFQGTFTQQLAPEPSSAGLVGGIGLGLVFLGSWHRRMRRAAVTR